MNCLSMFEKNGEEHNSPSRKKCKPSSSTRLGSGPVLDLERKKLYRR